MAKQRDIKKSKARKQLARPAKSFDPEKKSKYAQKKASQAKGNYSPTSPFATNDVIVEDDYTGLEPHNNL